VRGVRGSNWAVRCGTVRVRVRGAIPVAGGAVRCVSSLTNQNCRCEIYALLPSIRHSSRRHLQTNATPGLGLGLGLRLGLGFGLGVGLGVGLGLGWVENPTLTPLPFVLALALAHPYRKN